MGWTGRERGRNQVHRISSCHKRIVARASIYPRCLYWSPSSAQVRMAAISTANKASNVQRWDWVGTQALQRSTLIYRQAKLWKFPEQYHGMNPPAPTSSPHSGQLLVAMGRGLKQSGLSTAGKKGRGGAGWALLQDTGTGRQKEARWQACTPALAAASCQCHPWKLKVVPGMSQCSPKPNRRDIKMVVSCPELGVLRGARSPQFLIGYPAKPTSFSVQCCHGKKNSFVNGSERRSLWNKKAH